MENCDGVQIDEHFFTKLLKLEAADQKRVNKAISLFQKNPNHQSLDLKKMSVTKHPWWRIRASKQIRIALLKLKEDNRTYWVIVRAGTHEQIDQLVNGSSPYFNAGSKKVGFVTTDIVGEEIKEPNEEWDETKAHAKGIFSSWSREELVTAGIPEEWVDLLLICQSEDDLNFADVYHEMPDEVILGAIDLLSVTPKEWAEREIFEEEPDLFEKFEKYGEKSGLSKFFTDISELDMLLNGEIERWMVWLHPEQKAVVDANYAGPARIGGAAGTGKTSVALHRAKNLAQRLRAENNANSNSHTPRVAFITYNRNQPKVLGNLYRRIPGTTGNDVEFTTLHQLAAKILRGEPRLEISKQNIPDEFNTAVQKVIVANSPLDRGTGIRFGIDDKWRQYLFDEVEHVIKGRLVASRKDYLELERKGRQHPLGRQQREQVWDLYEEFQHLLKDSGLATWTEQIQKAYEKLERTGERLYDAVIVDEVQDISQIGLQMIRKCVNGSSNSDRPNGILIVGDGAQRIYNHFCSLPDAGINIVGRSTILKKNYRNREEILKFAIAVCKGHEFEDMGSESNREESIDVFEFGEGERPKMISANSIEDQSKVLIDEVRKLSKEGFSLSDMLVVTRHRADSKRYRKAFTENGIPTQDIRDYDGTPSGKISVGTIYMVKGLENKICFIPDLTAGEFLPSPQAPEEPNEAYSERQDNLLSLFWVAATRPRDRLIMTCVDEPSIWIKERAKGLYDFESS